MWEGSCRQPCYDIGRAVLLRRLDKLGLCEARPTKKGEMGAEACEYSNVSFLLEP